MKERIIACALVLFRQYGIKGVRMDDIASGTGISKRTLYEHFISKDELLDECLHVRLEEQRLLISTAGNLIDELLVLYTTIQSLDLKSILRFCLELQRFYKPLYRMLLVRLSDYAAACSEKVSSGINEGYLRPDTTPFWCARSSANILTCYLLTQAVNAKRYGTACLRRSFSSLRADFARSRAALIWIENSKR